MLGNGGLETGGLEFRRRANADVLLADRIALGPLRHVLLGFLAVLVTQGREDIALPVAVALASPEDQRNLVVKVVGVTDHDLATGQVAAAAFTLPDAQLDVIGDFGVGRLADPLGDFTTH